MKILIILLMLMLGTYSVAYADQWKVTAYCACTKCCGEQAQGITASGKKVEVGMVACNWLPFGTRLFIDKLGMFVVEDRGAKSLFGSNDNHIKHVDVYLSTHEEAKRFGVRYLDVEILEGKDGGG